jgi:hypothetical protein
LCCSFYWLLWGLDTSKRKKEWGLPLHSFFAVIAQEQKSFSCRHSPLYDLLLLNG